MRAWATLLVLALPALAGCSDGVEQVQDIPGDPLATYKDCGWANTTYAADCHVPGRDGYAGPPSVRADVPDGWVCVTNADYSRLRDDPEAEGLPKWWMYRGPPVQDGLPVPSDAYRLGFHFDMGDLPGPFKGVLIDVADPALPIVLWETEEPVHFVPLPHEYRDPEALLQGVVMPAAVARGDIDRAPTAMWNETYPRNSTLEVRGIEVERLEQAWGLHARFPRAYPQPYPTQVAHTDAGIRYLPTFDFPISWQEGDPRDAQGSAHWGSRMHGVSWTNVTDGAASIRIAHAFHLRLDVHVDDVKDGFHRMTCECLGIENDLERMLCLIQSQLPPVAVRAEDLNTFRTISNTPRKA